MKARFVSPMTDWILELGRWGEFVRNPMKGFTRRAYVTRYKSYLRAAPKMLHNLLRMEKR